MYLNQVRTLLAIILVGLGACTAPGEAPVRPEQTSPYSWGWLTEYDVWEFLGAHPSEAEVLATLGAPDSVWVSADRELKVLYYYIPALSDYNSVEVNTGTGKVSGFEWD